MRIALLAPFGLRTKGTARARTLPLARALARRGHSVAVFVPPYDSIEDAGHRWQEAGVEVINVTLPPGGQSAPWHWQLGWRLYAAAARWRPQVVHAFKPKGPSGLAATLFWTRRQGGRPRLIVDADDWEGPGGWNDHPAAGYSEGQKRFFTWQERYGLSHADAWTVTSACLRDRALSLGARPQDVHVLHNGIEPGDKTPRNPVSDPAQIILYTRFAGVCPDDVIDIWRRVRELKADARLVVVGRGSQGQEAQVAGLPGAQVAGWLEADEVRGVLARMAVAIAPWANTATNRARHSAKILELMNAGLPVVAYDVGEMAVTLGAAGVLLQPGDSARFAEAVVGLVENPERRRVLGMHGQERVRTLFNWDVLAEVALSAYHSL
ncbi:MAG: glycosyltransferase family 4 protein [Nitrososphaerales archaeon]